MAARAAASPGRGLAWAHMTDNQLGEFLRARPAAVQPHEVGTPSHGARRVAGCAAKRSPYRRR